MSKKADRSDGDAAGDPLKAKILSLTWDGLRKWSDPRSVERGREYLSNVEDPARFDDGSIVAEVHGSDDYFTRLRIDADGELQGDCTCPVGYRCKHTIALALFCAKRMKSGEEIERADAASRKWKRALTELDYARDDDFDDDDDRDDDDLECDDFNDAGEDDSESVDGKEATKRPQKPDGDKVRSYITNLSEQGLRELADDLLENIPEVRSYIAHKLEVRKASDADLVRMARSAVRDATSGWYDYWEAKKGRCELPDYSLVKEYFGLIAKSGGWKELKELAEELKRKAFNQAERSRDEYGNISSQVSACMDIAAKAVMEGGLDPVEKLKWYRDIRSCDDYCVLDYMEVNPEDAILADKKGWGRIVDYLLGKDKQYTVVGETGYRGSIHEIAVALEKAGREAEAVTLLKGEPDDERYQKELVDLYLRLGRRDEAEATCRRNLASMAADDTRRHDNLQRLKAMAEEDGAWETVALCELVDFIAYPRIDSYKELKSICEKGKVWKRVREGVLGHLERGTAPDKSRNWPLPQMLTAMPSGEHVRFPKNTELCEIAIFEKRPKDALEWFKAAKAVDESTYRYGSCDSLDWAVADAVCAEFPDEAIAIWHEQVRSNLGSANDSCYTTICRALKKMRPVMKKQGRLSEWQGIIEGIRAEYKRRRNLMQMLRNLESERGGKVVDWEGRS